MRGLVARGGGGSTSDPQLEPPASNNPSDDEPDPPAASDDDSDPPAPNTRKQNAAQGDLINDIRANQAGYEQDISVDGIGEGAEGITVQDTDGGAEQGGTTVIDPDTSKKGDAVGITETQNDEGEDVTVVAQEDGTTTTAVQNDRGDDANSPNQSGSSEEVAVFVTQMRERFGSAGRIAAAVAASFILAMLTAAVLGLKKVVA